MMTVEGLIGGGDIKSSKKQKRMQPPPHLILLWFGKILMVKLQMVKKIHIKNTKQTKKKNQTYCTRTKNVKERQCFLFNHNRNVYLQYDTV